MGDTSWQTTTWEVRKVRDGQEGPLLNVGWEPFAVCPSGATFLIWLRRPTGMALRSIVSGTFPAASGPRNHRDEGGSCGWCGQPWPCPAARQGDRT